MSKPKSSDRAKFVGAIAALAVSLLVSAWLLGYFQRDPLLSDDADVADLQRAMQQVKSQGKSSLESAETKQLIQQYQQLAPAQQREFDRRKTLTSMPAYERELADFFALPADQQWAQIDREIDQSQAKMRRLRATAADSKKQRDDWASDPRQIMAAKQAWSANASPELRAMMDRRVRMINERREQRGLQPF